MDFWCYLCLRLDLQKLAKNFSTFYVVISGHCVGLVDKSVFVGAVAESGRLQFLDTNLETFASHPSNLEAETFPIWPWRHPFLACWLVCRVCVASRSSGVKWGHMSFPPISFCPSVRLHTNQSVKVFSCDYGHTFEIRFSIIPKS